MAESLAELADSIRLFKMMLQSLANFGVATTGIEPEGMAPEKKQAGADERRSLKRRRPFRGGRASEPLCRLQEFGVTAPLLDRPESKTGAARRPFEFWCTLAE